MAENSPSVDRRESTAGELQELEPSPVEETPRDVEKDAYFPPSSPPGRSSGLGLSGHSPSYYLIRIQKYSSIAFTFFAGLHFTNTALIPLLTRSVPASEPYLLLTRPLYQSPTPIPLEPLLIFGPAAAHITAGLTLRLLRRRAALRHAGAESHADRRKIPWPRVSGISKMGLGLAAWLALHVFQNRAWPLLARVGEGGGGAEINLGYVSHVFARSRAFAGVAYAMLVVLAAGHMTWGMAKWMGWTPEQVGQRDESGMSRKKRRWYGINAAWVVLGGVWFAGLGVVARGGDAGGWIGRQYDTLLRGMPVLGRLFR